MYNLSTILLSSVRASIQTCRAVCLAMLDHQNLFITNSQVLGPVEKKLGSPLLELSMQDLQKLNFSI